MSSPKRGEIWLADLEPTVGQEINKTRPVVVVSGDAFGVLALRLAAPITGATPAKAGKVWLVPLRPTASNGLSKESVVDVFQVRSLSVARLMRQIGVMSSDDLAEVTAAIAVVLEVE
jgi:mRNA interferase MazF